jgi:hypothetical protein
MTLRCDVSDGLIVGIVNNNDENEDEMKKIPFIMRKEAANCWNLYCGSCECEQKLEV